MDKNTFFALLDRYQDGTASPAERALVEEYYHQLEASAITNLAADEEIALREKMYQQIKEASIDLETGVTTVESEPAVIPSPTVHRIHFRRFGWWAAAAIILMLGAGSYFVFFNKPAKQYEIVKLPELPIDVKAPETNRAMITLVDGSKVYLDSAGNGQLAMQGNSKIVKLANGQISYQSAVDGQQLSKTIYNTLSNPRGSKVIDMTLADGSRVWLNAGSSVTYPVAFISNERKVEILGEAYFEVARNTEQPFIVNVNNKGEVKVLGTHFNINAYDNEPAIKVTLLEGSIKMTIRKESKILKPGQQARVTSDIKIVDDVDPDEVMAWKNGQFNFRGTSLQSIMNQLVRWYDVEVVYEGVQPMSLTGYVDRNVPLSQVLQLLESNGVRFRQEGKKIIMLK